MSFQAELFSLAKKSRLYRALLLIILILFFIIVMVLAFLDLMKLYDKSVSDIAVLTGISILLISILAIVFKFILNYLDVNRENNIVSGEDIINSTLGYDSTLNSELKDDLIKEIKEKIQNEATDDYLDEIRGKIKCKDMLEYSKFQSNQTFLRIQNAIAAQNAKANFNLALGVITAVIGIAFLVFFIPNYNEPTFDLSQFLYAFLPRLSIVILIETFAYFFLKMYKYNLNEIKYFQNEATSIEHRLQGLNIAIQLDGKENIETILLAFTSFDKNKEKNNEITENMPLSLDYLVKIAEVLKETKS
ncbi:hypothetical protein BKG95_03690 [Rodentibacter pneumotropicus]|uniref:hypothetical protein n=1 Tax=Rodentibacter pneumotropicus TaxID=758 RepID=UPI0009898505|nr:hypothetical protein [Rodentibacter pneumotropicus]OOF68513.1 hypothetical protein BKG95_03690 [Rodentibacter pneumotropicus]